MNESDSVIAMVLIIGLFVCGFMLGKITTNDQWKKKPCDQYTQWQYTQKEIPARCIK